LQNAAKFTPRAGRVTVGVSTDSWARQAVFRVADAGAGMAPEMLARLFEPFMQADTTLDRSKGGLGLGLALVKGLVEQHGGSVEARSEGIGRGSEFIARLPLDLSARPEGERRCATCAKVRRRVLVIENNLDAADSLRELLVLDGHDVAVAYDGVEGIARARVFRPEVVLCEIGLPGMDGYAVARALRAEEGLWQAHLVVVSGYALPEDLQRAAEAGFERHLAEPPASRSSRTSWAACLSSSPLAGKSCAGWQRVGASDPALSRWPNSSLAPAGFSRLRKRSRVPSGPGGGRVLGDSGMLSP
jgi:two-component system CheB/CheR fusion protein